MTHSDCPFCNLEKSRALLSNDHALAFAEGFPVTPGHSLIVPKRHLSSFFEATGEERSALFDLVAEMRQLLPGEQSPDGFNIGFSIGFNDGFNDGPADGRTILHLHIHLIPPLCRRHRRPARRCALDHA
jgi:diadenosine tetraphosphate (Ap4A) HIT family hydrolase